METNTEVKKRKKHNVPDVHNHLKLSKRSEIIFRHKVELKVIKCTGMCCIILNILEYRHTVYHVCIYVCVYILKNMHIYMYIF